MWKVAFEIGDNSIQASSNYAGLSVVAVSGACHMWFTISSKSSLMTAYFLFIFEK